MDPEELHLERTRGFGPTDPVPFYRLADAAHDSRPPEYSESAEHEIFSEGTRLVGCPDTHNSQDVNLCRTCPFFQGIGVVGMIKGSDPVTTEQQYRILCAHPSERRLFPHNSPPMKVIKHKLRKAWTDKHSRDRESPGAVAEWELFIETGNAINCPKAKSQIGEWSLRNTPCLDCDAYRGVRLLKKKSCDGYGRTGQWVVDCGVANTRMMDRIVDPSELRLRDGGPD